MGQVTLVTGASRGLGLAFTRQLLARGEVVYAAARDPHCEGLQALFTQFPDRCRPVALDLVQEETFPPIAARLAADGETLDRLIHNAGIFAVGEEGLETLDGPRMAEVLQVNVIGPLLLTRHLLPHLSQPGAIVAALTSGVGRPAKEREKPGLQYSYGISKAALFVALSKLDADLFPRGVTTVGLNPGFVQTDMTAGAPTRPPLTPDQSVQGMLKVLDHLTPKDSGQVFSHAGHRVS